MKTYITLLLATLAMHMAHAQTDTLDIATPKDTDGSSEIKTFDPNDTNQVYHFTQEKPVYKGGEHALLQYITKQVKYPEMEKENNIEGTVFIKYVVEKDGTTTGHAISRGVMGGPNLGTEALNACKGIRYETPAKQNGKPVRCEQLIPIKFKLADDPPPLWTYPSGQDSLTKFIRTQMVYPAKALKKKETGTVHVTIEVDENGKPTNVKADHYSGDTKNKDLQKEAIRICKLITRLETSSRIKSKGDITVTINFDTNALERAKNKPEQ